MTTDRSSAVASHGTTIEDANLERFGAVPLLAGAVAFFVGSAVLFQSGEPGASTPAPWLGSHAIWSVATVLVAIGTLAVDRRLRATEHTTRAGWSALAGRLASGAAGLGVLTALQWTAWVYVDVVAYRNGDHELLFDPLLHPFGTAHALLYGVLLGSLAIALAWRLHGTSLTHRVVDYGGALLGTATIAAAGTAIVTVASVEEPAVLAVVGLLAALYGWLFVVGASLYRSG